MERFYKTYLYALIFYRGHGGVSNPKWGANAPRLIAIMLFVVLHLPSGQEVYINQHEIMIIRPNTISHTSCKSEILVHDVWLCTRESPEEVKRLIDESR